MVSRDFSTVPILEAIAGSIGKYSVRNSRKTVVNGIIQSPFCMTSMVLKPCFQCIINMYTYSSTFVSVYDYLYDVYSPLYAL
jgi:hypothetical protein